jgi:hypothetical protein
MRKKHTQEVKFWEGQLALFQPVTLKRLKTWQITIRTAPWNIDWVLTKK